MALILSLLYSAGLGTQPCMIWLSECPLSLSSPCPPTLHCSHTDQLTLMSLYLHLHIPFTSVPLDEPFQGANAYGTSKLNSN